MHFISLRELDANEGSVQLYAHDDASALILHPRPNPRDPNDPLRWPQWKKHLCFASIAVFTFLTNFGIAGAAPAFYVLSLEFDKSQAQISHLLSWTVLTLGLFNFFWVPMANYFGKRPVFVLSALVMTLGFLWGAVAKSYGSLLWSNIIAAFAGSATETLGAAIVNDLYFLHERGAMMGWYMTAIANGDKVGALICGFVVTGRSWRWQKWIAFILMAVDLVAIVLFCTETRYDRSSLLANNHLGIGSECHTCSGSGHTTTEALASNGDIDTEKTASASAHDIPAAMGSEVPRRSWLALWSRTPIKTSLWAFFLRPLPLICLPAVIFAFLGYAVSLAWVLTILVTNPFVLQAPPYNWRPSINGLITIPGILGNLFGAWAGGWLVDRYSRTRTQANGGAFSPETRLNPLVLPALIVPAGCLLYGYGVGLELHWTAIFFGCGMVSVGLTAVPSATAVYVSDCYLAINADALQLVNGLKNIFAFGLLYGIVPWVTEAGYINSFGTQAGIYVAVMALAIPSSFYGDRLRHASAQWRIILQ